MLMLIKEVNVWLFFISFLVFEIVIMITESRLFIITETLVFEIRVIETKLTKNYDITLEKMQ